MDPPGRNLHWGVIGYEWNWYWLRVRWSGPRSKLALKAISPTDNLWRRRLFDSCAGVLSARRNAHIGNVEKTEEGIDELWRSLNVGAGIVAELALRIVAPATNSRYL